jgi:hypothetical protein
MSGSGAPQNYQKMAQTPTYGGGYQTQQNGVYNRPFTYAPGVQTPQAHQYFEGTGPGGGPAPVDPGTPPPPGVGGLPPGMGPPPGDPPINSVPPGGPYPGAGGPPTTPPVTPPGTPPGISPPGIRPGINPKIGGGYMTQDKPGGPPRYLGPPVSDNFGNFGGGNFGGPQVQAPQVPTAPPPPAQNPLLAAIYSGQGGAFTPQQINSAGPLGSNKWDPAAASIAGSQAGYNTPAPMFQQGHIANGNAVMQNGQFTWTPQGLAAMKANSGVK